MKSIKIEKKKKKRIQGKHAKFDISCFGRCDQILQFHWSLNSESRNGGGKFTNGLLKKTFVRM